MIGIAHGGVINKTPIIPETASRHLAFEGPNQLPEGQVCMPPLVFGIDYTKTRRAGTESPCKNCCVAIFNTKSTKFSTAAYHA